jgi:hypothetical protein
VESYTEYRFSWEKTDINSKPPLYTYTKFALGVQSANWSGEVAELVAELKASVSAAMEEYENMGREWARLLAT